MRLEHVTVSRGGKEILRDLSYEFPENGVVCVTGASGTGKTTLLYLLAGLLKPDKGFLLPAEKPALLFQEDRLLPWLSALENAALAGNKEQAAEYLRLFGLENDMQKKPPELSGGMQRRVALARCFTYGGDVFLLDEPFRGLDGENAACVRREVKRLAAERPVVLVTHDRTDIGALAAAELPIA